MDREITLRDYGRVIWSGRWLILAAAVIAAIVGAILSFVTPTTYTAEAEVALGQVTSVTGSVISTAITNPATAPEALKIDSLITQVAKEIDVSPKRVKDGVDISAARVAGASVSGLPTLLTVRFKDDDRRVAVDGANAYLRAINHLAEQDAARSIDTYRTTEERAQADVDRLNDLIAQYQRQLAGTSDPNRVLVLQSVLFSASTQLSTAQTNLSEAELNRIKAEQIELPRVLSLASDPTSSGSLGNRARAILLAAVIGLVVGVIVTFVWRGSPGGRARRE